MAGERRAATARRPRGRRGGGELREAILAATDRLLVEAGNIDSVSIDAITRAVGCTPPALYHWFPDKAALLRAVGARQYARFGEELSLAVEGVDDPRERLRSRGRAYLRFGLEHPEHYRILFMARPGPVTGNDPAAGDSATAPGEGLRNLVEDVQAAMTAGLLAADDPLGTAVVLWGLVHGLTSLAIANPAIPPEFMAARLEAGTSALLRGLAPAG